MTAEQSLITGILAVALALFIRGPWRHDIVAMLALLAAVAAGLVPAGDAFAGFGHPAVITVAAVLVISRALTASGAVDFVLRAVTPAAASPQGHVAALSGVAAVLSAFMNNVGALALMMPVALQSAAKAKRSAALLLMPLSFGSILGGLMTLIGTPPNIIVAAYRGEVTGQAFSMFDYTPVGLAVALCGVVYVALAGWRLIPEARRRVVNHADLFQVEDYVAELRVPRGSAAVAMPVADLEAAMGDIDIQVVGLIRRKKRTVAGVRRETLKAADLLIVEGAPAELDRMASKFGLKIVGAEEPKAGLLVSADTVVAEAVVNARSAAEGRTVASLRLRGRFGVNLLAISRQGRPYRDRLRQVRLRAGDVLLLQGNAGRMPEVIAALGCLALAGREMQLGQRDKALLAAGLFAAALAAAAIGVVSAPVALAAAALAMVLTNLVSVREVYGAVDWPVIVLLGALIPVAGALQTTGTTGLIAEAILGIGAGAAPWLVLTIVLLVTMTLSDLMNNAATALVMAPIAMSIAGVLGVSPDPFLMAVALGASCAFLTPIGHQNNTLIMGPGGYAFGDYWRMGLPLEALIVAVGVPMILWVWPL